MPILPPNEGLVKEILCAAYVRNTSAKSMHTHLNTVQHVLIRADCSSHVFFVSIILFLFLLLFIYLVAKSNGSKMGED